MKVVFRISPLVLGVLLLLPMSLLAQAAQIGTIRGEVMDQTGASLPGVTVELRSQERGWSRNTVTDSRGEFLFTAVPLGRYTVEASLSGFQGVTLTDNVVESQKITTLRVEMPLASEAVEITVTGDVPIVDKTNTTQTSRLSEKEFEKLPIGRSYQTLFGIAPGVVGTGNANVNGALSSNNLFMFDGVDVTDPTTGTFGTNLNFEAIEEVNIYTSGVSAEYGRAVGGVINVITKSGTNTFEGSVKYIASNDDWNEQNKTKNEVTGASLARTKNDILNDRWSYTLGGPILRDRAWFFGAYENFESTSSQRTTAVTGENYTQTTESPFVAGRVTVQLTPSHNVFGRYHDSPTNGFVVAYWGSSATAELNSLTSQDQGADSLTFQWTGVFSANLAGELMYAQNDEFINVRPFKLSPLHGGAPHFSLADRKYYNGATFDGFVQRPRDQAIAAASYFTTIGGNSHNFKAGIDWQHLESAASFAYPNAQLYIDRSFNPGARTFEPFLLRDYDDPRASTSEGDVFALYVRDKFEVGPKLFFELGARFEQQDGSSDIGETTVDTQTISPRLSASYDLRGDGKSILLGTGARLYQYILQDFSDEFAQVPQQSNYDLFQWDGTEFQFVSRTEVAGSSFRPNLGLDPTYVDELTLGFQQQLGSSIGVGVRAIWRQWGDLIDDLVSFDSNGDIVREVVNYGFAEREYNALQFTFDKRFSNRWNAFANYTWGETTGNHFSNVFSVLGDFLDADCQSTDPTVGTLPCRDVVNSSLRKGGPSYDRTHNIKFGGAYVFNLGPVNLTLGTVGDYISGPTFEKVGTARVINPVTGKDSGETVSYLYSRNGSDNVDSFWGVDSSIEVTWPIVNRVEVGFKGEVFNVFDNQEKTSVDNTTWCNADTSACQTSRSRYGKATRRGSFQDPRSYRVTGLIRF